MEISQFLQLVTMDCHAVPSDVRWKRFPDLHHLTDNVVSGMKGRSSADLVVPARQFTTIVRIQPSFDALPAVGRTMDGQLQLMLAYRQTRKKFYYPRKHRSRCFVLTLF